MTLYPYRPDLNRILYRCLSVGTLSTLSLLLGLVPSLSERSVANAFSSSALAQPSPDDMETRFARTVIDIEKVRQPAYNQIKQKTGGNVPEINCYERSSLNALPGDIRNIAIDYCDKSERIIKQNQLSVEDFNKITRAIAGNPPANPALKQKIQAAMLRIQR